MKMRGLSDGSLKRVSSKNADYFEEIERAKEYVLDALYDALYRLPDHIDGSMVLRKVRDALVIHENVGY